MARLEGKCAVVTGAARGIGAALAKGIASEGARVLAVDVEDASGCANDIRSAGGIAEAVRADVANFGELEAMATYADSLFGSIDILVNNAGIFASLEPKPFWEISDEEWDRVMTVNARSVFQAAKACLPRMRKAGGGKIVNISSGTFFYGPPGWLHYVASKGAVIAMTRSMSRELGQFGILVNSIAPGFTESEGVLANAGIHETMRIAAMEGRSVKRAMLPEDLVGAAVFLVSSESDFLTGQTIVVDGGKLVW